MPGVDIIQRTGEGIEHTEKERGEHIGFPMVLGNVVVGEQHGVVQSVGANLRHAAAWFVLCFAGALTQQLGPVEGIVWLREGASQRAT